MTPAYDARIRRAEYLTTAYPFAAEILAFYRRICVVQQKLSMEFRSTTHHQDRRTLPGTLREQMDVNVVLPRVEQSLSELLPSSPEPLALYISEFLRGSRERWAASLERYVTQGGANGVAEDSREELLARILIDPYAEMLAAKDSAQMHAVFENVCPLCKCRPVTGVLRIEGDSGKRFLVCSFCATEWEFRRICCAFCGESNEQSLPVFVAQKFPHIRVEACDTCRHCIRSIDLTKDGHAIPVVDDLAAIPLALWADEYGYQRIHGNLLGT